jgi:uncharacterized membrane protein
LIKGVGALFETVGAGLLLFLNPYRMSAIVRFLTQHELSDHPKDIIANLLLSFSHGFTVNTQYFGVFYLASHGIIKCVLVYLLWRKKLWAYPAAMAVLAIFAAYQIFRVAVHPSVFLFLLTVFDITMIALTAIEYKRIKAGENTEKIS